MNYSIEINDLTKIFNIAPVLNKVSLKISEGENFGLLGPSGAGKTTLIKILIGQLRQTEGEALLLGKDTRELTQDIYLRLGMVLDNSGLYERLSCYDNLVLFTEIYGVSKSVIDSVLKKVGLLEAKKLAVHKLSKGMKQRLVLARAILNSPKVLFLDEPTSGLDPGTAGEIHRLILEEKMKGTTVFLTTHNMEEASKLCDNIALLHEGRIVEYGKPEEICRRYNHQNKLQLFLKNGETVFLKNDENVPKAIEPYFKENLVEAIHSTEPSLETVFMELTGRSFQ
ncbi:ABC transporter ATP-binding protein [Alloiococcus sp. CFN-8]|uniref:ABC transporter ATP-binding protein n=1 Tax=Alloiococcus sp. CFN-8 TaxID=3416081 RepID=UPI003CE8A8FB